MFNTYFVLQTHYSNIASAGCAPEERSYFHDP